MLTIGADPEVFLFNKETDSFISSIGLIGGSKKEPRLLERPGFALQEDNVAVEFNIPPASSVEQFVESIQWSLDRIKQEVDHMGYEVAIIPAAEFSEKELSHPNARVAGCDPDYNAWTRRQNPRPPVAAGNLRTGAGHVHIGVNPVPNFSREAFIKALDLYLGVPSVVMDKDVKRKHLYGKAGAFRPTSYGLEYRVLSNFWLHSHELMAWVYEQTHKAYEAISEKGENFFNGLQSDICNCINFSDKELSEQLMRQHHIAHV